MISNLLEFCRQDHKFFGLFFGGVFLKKKKIQLLRLTAMAYLTLLMPCYNALKSHTIYSKGRMNPQKISEELPTPFNLALP